MRRGARPLLVGLFLVGLGFLVGACAPSPAPGAPPAPPAAAPTPTPVLAGATPTPAPERVQRGGVLNWYVYADPARLDIHSESPLAVQQVVAGIYSGLLHYNPNDPKEIIGDLAESWESSADGTKWTFKLRKGVRWHDGTPLTAQDVKTSFDRVLGKLDPKFRSPRCGALMRPLVEEVSVVDDYTVTFTLKFPAAPFIPSLASAWCRVVPKHVLEKFGDFTKPEAQVGSGPFRFKRYERNVVIEWERNPDYFIKDLPYLDGVKQFVLIGRATQLAAAKTGRIHLWDTWPPMTASQAQELKRARGDEIEIYQWPINTIMMVHLNLKRPPFDNKDLRIAVHLALNRQEIVDKAFEGAGVPCAILDPKLHGEYALPLEEVQKFPGCRQPKTEDLERARQLVAKHFPDGLDIEVAVRQVGNYVDRTQLVVAQLREIGIRGTIRTYESAAGYTAYGKGDFQMIGAQDTAMVHTDPSSPFSLLYITPAGRNWGKMSDPRIDELADRGLRTLDPAQRRQIYHELQRYIWTQDPGQAVPMLWVEGWFFRDRRVQNYNPALTIYDNNTFMTVWLKQ